MAKEQNTTVIAIRLPDQVLEALKARAKVTGLGHTVLARQIIQENLGLKGKY